MSSPRSSNCLRDGSPSQTSGGSPLAAQRCITAGDQHLDVNDRRFSLQDPAVQRCLMDLPGRRYAVVQSSRRRADCSRGCPVAVAGHGSPVSRADSPGLIVGVTSIHGVPVPSDQQLSTCWAHRKDLCCGISPGMSPSSSNRSLQYLVQSPVHSRSNSLTSIKSVSGVVRDVSTDRLSDRLTDRSSNGRTPICQPGVDGAVDPLVDGRHHGGQLVNVRLPGRTADLSVDQAAEGLNRIGLFKLRERDSSHASLHALTRPAPTDAIAENSHLVRSRSVDQEFISRVAGFQLSPTQQASANSISGPIGDSRISRRDSLVVDLQTRVSALSRECCVMRLELDRARDKLNSSAHSIRTFWSPELKRERTLRKEESSRLAVVSEQLRTVLHATGQSETAIEIGCQNIGDDSWFSAQVYSNGSAANETGDRLPKMAPGAASDCQQQSTTNETEGSPQFTSSRRRGSPSANRAALTNSKQQQERLQHADDVELLKAKLCQETKRVKQLQQQLQQRNDEVGKTREESTDYDVLRMRLETLQKQVEDQQEHICVLRDTISLKDRQASILQSDVDALRSRLAEKDEAIEKHLQMLKSTQLEKKQSDNKLYEVAEHMKVKEKKIDVLQRQIAMLEDLLEEKDNRQETRQLAQVNDKLNKESSGSKLRQQPSAEQK